MAKWLVDRSRHITGLQECPTKRYWLYHHGGLGIQSGKKGLELWTGGLVHKMLEFVLILLKITPQDQEPSREALRIAISSAMTEYSKEPQPECTEFTFKEQVALSEGLLWAWIRSQMPLFRATYEIVSIEQEMPLELPNDITLMTRPDIILRKRSTGKLVLCDWKTAAGINDEFIQEFQHAPQMAAGTLAAEKHLGESVEEYMIFALIKGSRKHFTKGKGAYAKSTPEKRTYSSLVYSKIAAAQPPFNPDPIVDLEGYWFDKSPVWESTLLAPLPEQSLMERYVDLLPLEALMEQFLIIGPYPRQDFMIKQFLDSLQAEESQWISRKGISTEEAMRIIPKSFKCHSYGSLCQFYNLCFKIGEGWKEPLENGFQARVPHHTTELR